MGGKTDYLGYIDIAKLDEHLDEYGTLTGHESWYRRRYEADPARYTRHHAIQGCRVWRRGVGIIIGGEGFSPSQVLANRTTRTRACGCLEDRASGVLLAPCTLHHDPSLMRRRNRAVVPPIGIKEDWR